MQSDPKFLKAYHIPRTKAEEEAYIAAKKRTIARLIAEVKAKTIQKP